jgi:hypothetical protein
MDFAQLVAKMNEIENSKPEEVIQESGKTTTEVGSTKDLLKKFNEIQDANPYVPVVEVKEEEVQDTMQDRFARFLKAERSAGADVQSMQTEIEEGVAEYEQADQAFKKILEMINMLEKMVREGGTLEKRIIAADGGKTSRIAPLASMRQALSDAYDACEDAYQDAMGDFVVGEETSKEE